MLQKYLKKETYHNLYVLLEFFNFVITTEITYLVKVYFVMVRDEISREIDIRNLDRE